MNPTPPPTFNAQCCRANKVKQKIRIVIKEKKFNDKRLPYKCYRFAGSLPGFQLPSLPVNPALAQSQSLWYPPAISLESFNNNLPSISSTSMIVADGIIPIPTKLIEKIWQWEFIDLSKLMSDEPSTPERSSVLINGVSVYRTKSTCSPWQTHHFRHSDMDKSFL